MLPAHSVPDYIDEEVYEAKENDDKITGVLLQAADFGGVIPLPFYGFSRLSADYFNCKLLLQIFHTVRYFLTTCICMTIKSRVKVQMGCIL